MYGAVPTPTSDPNVEEEKKPDIFEYVYLKVKGQVHFFPFIYINFMYWICRLMYFCSLKFNYCYDSFYQCRPFNLCILNVFCLIEEYYVWLKEY